jgi:hypothetical protein
LSSHKYDKLSQIIGKAESIKATEEGLRVKFKYFTNAGNEEADWGFFLVQNGIAAFSIGFMGYGYKDNSREEAEKQGFWREWTEIELLEISQVTIPSNRDAVLGRSQEGEGIEKELCELAIKSIDFSKVDKQKIIEEEAQKAGQAIEEVKADIMKTILDSDELEEKIHSIVSDELLQAKHYSNEIFGDAVDIDLKQTPLNDEIIGAVKDAFKKN